MQTSLARTKIGRTEQWLIKQKLNVSYLWWILISAINAALFITCYKTDLLPYRSDIFSVSNLLLATLVQNALVLPALYRSAVAVSKNVTFGKYYINVSVHRISSVHAAFASWGFIWLLIDVLQHLNDLNRPVLFTTSFPLLFLLLSLILTALPPFRQRFDRTFEQIHRYLSWLFFAVLVLHITWLHFSIDFKQSLTLNALLSDPMFLMTMLMITSVALPWLTLERIDRFSAERPSSDVLVLTIPDVARVGTCARISTDLIEWHSVLMARITLQPQSGESRVQLIFQATENGTRDRIERIYRQHSLEHLWIRSVKSPGFLFSIHAYSRVLIIVTGVGIASALPYLASRDRKVCLLWIGHNHSKSYGEDIWSMVSTYPDLKLYDTNLHGEPNVSELAIQAIREFRPQAIFCVANTSITRIVIDSCLVQGLPAYGMT